MRRLLRCSQIGLPMYSLPTTLTRRWLRVTNCRQAGSLSFSAAHRVSRHDVHFYAADDQASGLLARRLEIENLEREVRAQRLIVEQSPQRWRAPRPSCRIGAAGARRRRGRTRKLSRSQMHALQLESVRLEELINRVRHRSGQIDDELQEIEANEREARAQREQADARFEQLDAELSPRQEAVESARLRYEECGSGAACGARAAAHARHRAPALRVRAELESRARSRFAREAPSWQAPTRSGWPTKSPRPTMS